MKIYDVSVPLRNGMVVWPGDVGFKWEEYRRLSEGAASTNSKVAMGMHTGTHIDAPAHFFLGGATIDQTPPDVLIGPARVFQIGAESEIEAKHLEELDWEGVVRVIIKTRNTGLLREPKFAPDFVHFAASGAQFLVDKGIKLLGIDYLGVDAPHSPTHPAHNILLPAGVVIVEGMDLTEIEPGDYELFCAPLRIQGAEAAPARVFLVKSV